MMKIYLSFISVILLSSHLALAETSCDELNTLYIDKYVSDFSLHAKSFEIDELENKAFSCDKPNKNYILARAINDLDLWRPTKPNDPDYYELVSQVLNLQGTDLRYIPLLKNFPNNTARTIHDGGSTFLFLTDNYTNSSERIRPTYTLVHEARHTLKGKSINGHIISDEPGHVTCTRGKHKGLRVCDDVLGSFETLVAGSGNSHEFLFLLYIRSHPHTSKLVKQEAQEQLNYLATHMFNTLESGILKHYKVQLQ